MTTIGIIGGSGIYSLPGLTDISERRVETPYGAPSDVLVTGRLGEVGLVFVPRHGRGHVLTPAEVPYRANIFAMKSLGVDWLISVSAVGSMREHIRPGDLVIPDQYIDRTSGRERSFFGNGIVAHVSMADPTCEPLAEHIVQVARELGVNVYGSGTYVAIDGPQFSTRAESQIYRGQGIDIIGMTAMPEAKLAREAEMHYLTLGMVTDYDCWHLNEAAVTVEAVWAVLKKNTETVSELLARALPGMAGLSAKASCDCASALSFGLVTDRSKIPPQRVAELGPLVRKYLA